MSTALETADNGHTVRLGPKDVFWCRREGCTRLAVIGGKQCDFHGGTPSQRVGAIRKLTALRYQAETGTADIDLEDLGDPVMELRQLAMEAMAWKRHLSSIVADLRGSYRDQDAQGREQINANVELFERAMDRCQKYLVEMVKLGLEERLVKISELQAVTLTEVIRAVLGRYGIDITDASVREVVAGEIEAFATPRT